MDGNPNPTTASSSGSASSGNTGPQHGIASDSDEEDTESESSSSSSRALRDFRKKWQNELKESPSCAKTSDSEAKGLNSSSADQSSLCAPDTSPIIDVEEEAKHLFLMGVGLERQGDLYEAVRCYRRAMQLVPDIENRVNQNETPANEATSQNDSDSEHEPAYDEYQPEDEEDCDGDLKTKFLKTIEKNGWKFFEKVRSDTKVHLNDIPVEVLTYILRWLVSDELDLRSLDIVSQASKGFYCLCRDEELWKMACERVWHNTDGFIGSEFSSYREMFLSRPRVRLEGCYISKVSYVRPGEHSFQDQSYRPWHLVEYYRYLRFFPDGTFHFLTTSEQPVNIVSGLRDRTPKHPDTLQGTYALTDENLVSADATKTSINYNTRGGKSKQKTPSTIASFHLEFRIEEHRGRSSWVLSWKSHSLLIITLPGPEPNPRSTYMRTDFEISYSKYPPLYFSRVKSYTNKSENVLAQPPPSREPASD